MAAEPAVALDMESNGFFHYKERVSLVQLSVPEANFLLDPLAVKDLSALGKILGDPSVHKVLHGCDYDLRSFDREYGFHFVNFSDTAVATQLLNVELMGLGRALETYLNVKVQKITRLQRSDWSRRPIPDDALEYAVSDAAHLLKLEQTLRGKLQELGREPWFDEECQVMGRIRYEAPPPPEEACFGSKGAFDLTPRELAIFRELWMVREKSAEEADRPPFKIISAEALMAIARDPEIEWSKIPNPNMRWLEAHVPEIRDALNRGFKAEPLVHPSRQKRRSNPWSDEARARWRPLMEVRLAKATELGIAPATLWPTRCLEHIALFPDEFERELSGVSELGVRNWQREVLADLLRAAWSAASESKKADSSN